MPDPVISWFDLSNQDMRMTSSIYLVTLRKDIISPFAKESDEEKGSEEKTATDKPAEKGTGKDKKKTDDRHRH